MDAIAWEKLVEMLMQWGVLLGKAILVFVVGRVIIKMLLRVVIRVLERMHTDEMLIKFARSIANAGLMLVLVIAVLGTLGIDTTSLIAVLASAGLAIGLALQDSMKNFASGVLLLWFKPFTKDDYVDAGGTEGVVKMISLFSTVLVTLDNKEVIVPNGSIWGGVITNFTAQTIRRVDLVFGIGYGDDIPTARQVIMEVLEAQELVLKDPAPDVVVSELADSSVNFYVRPWVESENYFEVKYAVIEAVKMAFDARGVSIPFPQMDVHMEKAA
jgi:small conductance mechanosensitive channel